jgi:transposase InsO family protein
VEVSDFYREHAFSWPEVAARLDRSASTLRLWERQIRYGSIRLPPRGRPTLRSSRPQRQQVLALLNETGPGLGVPTLRECFPLMSRAELTDLLGRYRRLWRWRHPRIMQVLEWTHPGSVWAMDFTEAPCRVDGRWPHLLAVRDLASGMQLLWQPVEAQTAAVVLKALTGLFVTCGPPLVLKSDNGSAFCSGGVEELLEKERVIPLFSPPYRPQYNGAIEASIGALKVRTERQALLAGRPGQWTWDDVERAREEGNHLSRPWGEQGPSPQERWSEQRPIMLRAREEFMSSVAWCRQEVEKESAGVVEGIGMGDEEAAARERQAIQRALVEHGFLLFSRRRYPSPIPRPKVTIIP